MKGLIVFVKSPILGEVKTRLAKSIGAKKALKVYEQILDYTKKISLEVDCDSVIVFHHGKEVQKWFWQEDGVRNLIQSEGDLGAKMKSAFKALFEEGYKELIVIGSDCLEITTQHINGAYKALNESDFVIGPAQDGGYYLLGCKSIKSLFVFDNMPWSNASLFKETKKLIKSESQTVSLIEELSDIDYIEDIKPQFKVEL